MIKTEQFFVKMLEYFPDKETEYKKNIEEYGELLTTVVIEDVFMPEIIKMIKDDKERNKLIDIFNYFEEIVSFGEEEIVNIFSITALEVLGNDKEILNTARKYMGIKTIHMQICADESLGRKVDRY